MGVLQTISNSLGDKQLLDLVATVGLEFQYKLTLSLDDFSIFSVSHEFEVDSGLGTGHLELGLVYNGDFFFLMLCVAHLVCKL